MCEVHLGPSARKRGACSLPPAVGKGLEPGLEEEKVHLWALAQVRTGPPIQPPASRLASVPFCTLSCVSFQKCKI